MKCQKCNKNEATTHYTQIINGNKTECFLCSECAAENGVLNNFSMSLGGLDSFDDFDNFFSGFLSNPYTKSAGIKNAADDACDFCHMTFNEFLNGGKLGCSKCYESFSSRLLNPLKQIHGATRHTGKVPERTGGMLKKTRKIEKLESELKEAVNTQNFEKAAQLRDTINELKGQQGA